MGESMGLVSVVFPRRAPGSIGRHPSNLVAYARLHVGRLGKRLSDWIAVVIALCAAVARDKSTIVRRFRGDYRCRVRIILRVADWTIGRETGRRVAHRRASSHSR